MELTNTEKYSLIPSAISALVLFVCLVFLMPGAGNIFMSSVISVIAYPIIILFTCLGITLSIKVPIKNKFVHSLITTLLGATLGLIGYAAANSIFYMQGTILAFLASGAVAGIVVSLSGAANKALKRDADKAPRPLA